MGRVLVVDDDGSILKLLQVTFEMEGHEVLVADSGEKALEVATVHTPDVVVCDLMMPKMDGLTVLEQLRSRPKTKTIPFVLVTGSGRRGDAERAIELGANGYVIKPFDPFDLVKTVDKVMKSGDD